MANQVTGLDGYNFYLDEGTPDQRKLNTTPVAEGAPFTPTGLDSDTDFSSRLSVRPVDKAGNERTPGKKFTGLGVKTLNPTPEENPMSAPLVADIDAIVARCIAAGAGPSVTVAVVSPKGYMTKTYGAPGTGKDHHFRIASQTKNFTSHAVLRFVDQGLLSLDDKLSDFVDDVPNGEIITLEMMLMMRSGVRDYQLNTQLAMNFVLNPTSAMTVDQIIAEAKGPSMFPPGNGYYYTNSNYFLLGRVLEAVDPQHRTADQIIMQDVVEAAALVNTTFPVKTGLPPAPYAVAYDNNPILSFLGIVLKRDVSNQNPAWIWASGAIVSVISDMIKWGQVMRDGTLLSPESRELLMTTFSEQPSAAYGLNKTGPPTFKYGLGFIQVGSWLGVDGSWLGTDSCTMFEPQTGTVIAVYENFQTSSPFVLASLTTIWYEIANYLYPSSANYPGYLTGEPVAGTMASSLPKLSTSGVAAVYAPGEEVPDPPAFEPVTYINEDLVDEPVPDGAKEWRLREFGGGGGGGGGYASGSAVTRYGGSGGGGAAYVDTGWQNVSVLGPTFSLTRGVGGVGGRTPATTGNGTDGGDGGDSVFTSGGVTVKAGGGEGGGGSTSTTHYAGGNGGTRTVDGITGVTGADGTAGGSSNNTNTPNNTAGAAAGGGGGGAVGSNPPTGSFSPRNGGNSTTGSGGAASTDGPDQALGNPGPGGGGGAGSNRAGHGGLYGGGGGGAGGKTAGGSGSPGLAGDGGDGETLLEFR